MDQWLRAHIALPEDLRAIPSTHVRQLTTAYNPSSRRITHLWHQWTTAFMCNTHHSAAHIHIIKIIEISCLFVCFLSQELGRRDGKDEDHLLLFRKT